MTGPASAAVPMVELQPRFSRDPLAWKHQVATQSPRRVRGLGTSMLHFGFLVFRTGVEIWLQTCHVGWPAGLFSGTGTVPKVPSLTQSSPFSFLQLLC